MPPLDKKLFVGENDFDPVEIARGKVGNFKGDVDDRLKQFGWDGISKCCSVGLNLSMDNKRVEKGVLLVRGVLEEKISVEANKIWPEAKTGVSLKMRLMDGGIFTFSEGDLGSDLLDQEQVEYVLYKERENAAPTPLLEADLADEGVGQFSLRMTCVLSNNSGARTGVVVKYTVLLFPESKTALLEHFDLAQCAAWPGLRLTDGYIPLIPKPEKCWGCPTIPLILPGTPFAVTNSAPSPGELRRAIASMMAKTVVPETARSGAALTTRWRMLASNPAELRVRTGELTWPPAGPTAPERGK